MPSRSQTIFVPANTLDKRQYAVNVALAGFRRMGLTLSARDLTVVETNGNCYRVTRGNVCLSY
jgi:hypothetical protein